MKTKFKQKIVFSTDGTWRGSKLLVNNNEILCTSINIVGNQEVGLDFIISLTESSLTKQQVKEGSSVNAVGFPMSGEEEYYDDEDN